MSMSGYRRAKSRRSYAARAAGGGATQGGPEPKDTGHIYTQSELTQSIEDNQKAAAKAREQFGDDLSRRDSQKLAEVEQSGFSKVLRGVASVAEFIDRPRKLIQLGIRDVADVDGSRGDTEITAGHYWDVAMGRTQETVENLGADVVGEHGDMSTANLLDGVWSNDESDSWWDKTLRGVVSFAGDVATDPLSYVTAGASAVGTKAALGASKQTLAAATHTSIERILKGSIDDVVETAFERSVRTAIEEAEEPIFERLLKEATEEASKKNVTLSDFDLADLTERAVREAAGIPDELADDIGKIGNDAARELAGGVFASKLDELWEPISKRDWSRLDDAYIDHVFTRRDGKRLGHAFTTGGLRLGVPFSAAKTTKALPGTRGLSKKLPVAKQFRQWNESTVGRKFASMMPLINAEAPLIQAARRGDGGAMISYAENLARAAKREVGSAREQRRTLLAAQQLDNVMSGAALSDAEKDEVWALIYPSMQVGEPATDLVSKHGEDVVSAAAEFVDAAHATLGRAYQFLRQVDPQGVGFIESHIPLMFGDDFARAMRVVADSPKGMPFTVANAKDAEKVAAKLGVEVEELWLWLEAFDGLTEVGRGLRNTGSKAAVRKRRMGKTAVSRRGTFTAVDENGQMLFMVNPNTVKSSADNADDAFLRSVADGSYADELRKTGRYAETNEDAVPQLIVSLEATRSRLPDRELVGSVENGDGLFKVFRAGSDDGRVAYTVSTIDGRTVGGVIANPESFSMGLADEARGVMDQVFDIALEQQDDLLRLHGKGASTSEDALRFMQKRAQKMLERSGGDTLVDVAEDGLQRTWMDQASINAALAKVMRAVEAEYGVGAKLADDADALVTDPVQLIGNYLSQMSALAEQRALRKAATHLGGISSVRTATNLEGVMAAMGDLTETASEYYTRISEANGQSIVDILAEKPKMAKVPVGNGRFLEMPKHLVEHRRMKPLIKKLSTMSQRIEGQRRTLEALRRREVKRLIEETGIDPDLAADIVNATTGEVAALRAEFTSTMDEVTQELEDHMIEVWFRASRDGADAEEALAVITAVKNDMRRDARKALRDAEEAWAEQFPDATEGVVEKVMPLTGLDYDDPVKYAMGVNALLGPVVSDLAARREANLTRIVTRIGELSEERAEIVGRLADMGADKNTRTLTVGPGMQQRRAALESRQVQIDKQLSGLDSLHDYVAGARTGDDIHTSVIMQEIATDMRNVATAEAANAWDGVVAAGIDRVAALADAGGLDEATAKSARRALPATQKKWEKFVEAVEAGEANLGDEVFDDPWFWRIVANGYISEREAVREAAEGMRSVAIRDGLSASEIDEAVELYELLHMPDVFTNIRNNVSDRVARINDLAAAVDAGAEGSGNKLQQLAELYGALPNTSATNRTADQLLAASKSERAAMVAEMREFYGTKGLLLDGENEEMWINELGRHLRGYLVGHQQNLTARVAATVGQEELNGSAYALDRVIRDVLQAPYDNEAALRVVASETDQLLLQDAYARVYPNRRIRLEMTETDGFRIRISEVQPKPKAKPPKPREILKFIEEGKVTPAQLRDNGLGYIADLHDMRSTLSTQQRAVARQRNATARQLAEGAEIRKAYEDVLNTILDVRGGGNPLKLRKLTRAGTPSGNVVQSALYRKLLKTLPPEEADKLDWLVSHALLEASGTSSTAKRIARLENEELWSERLFKPAQETVERLEKLSADLLAEAEASALDEVRQFQLLADEFIGNVKAMGDLGRDVNERGLATAGNRVMEHTVLPDGRTADELVAALKRSAQALEGKAPDGLNKSEIKAFIARLDEAAEPIQMPTAGRISAEKLGLGGQLTGQEVDPLIAAVFRNMMAAHDQMFTPQGLDALQKSSREVLRWWRGAATVARVPFHARNVISAVANGMLISVGPQHYARVMPDYMAYRKAIRNGQDPFLAVSAKNRALFKAAEAEEVIGSGFVRSELGVALGTGGALKKANPLDADNFILFRSGAEMMQSLEDSVRLAAFARWFDEATPESAAFARQMVMVAHFDYQHLGELEQKFKAVAPFFVWTRRNVPLQLRAIYENPAYLQTFNHLSSAMRENFGSDRDDPYGAYTGSFAAPLPFGEMGDEENWSRWIFDPDLPFANLEDLPLFAGRSQDSALPLGGGALSPTAWMGWTAQLLAPQWSFAGEAVYGDEYDTNAPTGLNQVLRALNLVDFFDAVPDPTSAGDVRVGSQAAAAYRTALPFASEYLDFFGQGSPTREARMGFTNESEGIADRLVAFAQSQFGGGMGLDRQTPTMGRGAAFDAQQFIRDLTLKERQQLPLDEG